MTVEELFRKLRQCLQRNLHHQVIIARDASEYAFQEVKKHGFWGYTFFRTYPTVLYLAVGSKNPTPINCFYPDDPRIQDDVLAIFAEYAQKSGAQVSFIKE